jgi:cell division protein FtsB
MSLGLRENRRRRRREARWKIIRWFFIIGCIVAAGAYAYQTGSRLAARNIASLEQQLSESSQRTTDLEAQLQAQREQVSSERARAEEWRQRYERDVATGEIKSLFELVRTKIDDGLTSQRLRFILEQTESRRDCDANLQVKRLQVQTPLSGGTRSQAAFANGSVTIGIIGAPARDNAGNPEAWFDVTRPVTVRLTRPGGKATEAVGPLPLHPALVHGDREYRFSIVAGARGIAEVTMERCQFP